MRRDSPYEASVALVLAEAEALTALDGAAHELRQLGLRVRALTISVLLEIVIERPEATGWEPLATQIGHLAVRVDAHEHPASRRDPALHALKRARAAVMRASACQARLNELAPEGAA